MDYDNKNIVLHELIGLRARVIKSLDKKQEGTSGTVIDETKNTLVLERDGAIRRIIKKISVFKFYKGRKSFTVKGEEINFRAHERTEKGLKFYKRREH
jgi:ribonuclease P protein subunit POP4